MHEAASRGSAKGPFRVLHTDRLVDFAHIDRLCGKAAHLLCFFPRGPRSCCEAPLHRYALQGPLIGLGRFDCGQSCRCTFRFVDSQFLALGDGSRKP